MESLRTDYFAELVRGTVEAYVYIQGLESMQMASFPREIQFNSCVRGYHMYQDRWLPVRDETLACQHKGAMYTTHLQ